MRASFGGKEVRFVSFRFVSFRLLSALGATFLRGTSAGFTTWACCALGKGARDTRAARQNVPPGSPPVCVRFNFVSFVHKTTKVSHECYFGSRGEPVSNLIAVRD